jgi:site-specific DNA-methyltransferase (adenine-specific)/modification methylase
MREPDYISKCGAVRLYCGDCLEILPTIEAGSVDAVVTDPPYGINAVRGGKCFSTSNACATNDYLPIEGDDKPYDPSPMLGVAPVVVLWGANHYAERLPSRARWLVWDKREGCGSNPLADCELAWTSDTRPARLFHHRWMGMIRASEHGKRVHPSQKPVALMEWVIDVMQIADASVVIDPYMGSGTTGVACVKTGRRFIGIEKEPKYFEIAKRRIEEALNATPLLAEVA